MVIYPEDWTESKLLEHLNLVQGLTYTPENVKLSGALALRSSNIQNGRLSLLDNVYVNVNVPEEKIFLPYSLSVFLMRILIFLRVFVMEGLQLLHERRVGRQLSSADASMSFGGWLAQWRHQSGNHF